MKRIITALALILLLSVGLCACGGGSEDEVYYTVSFDSDGGTPVESQRVKAGERAIIPEKPLKSGYTFQSWLLDGVAYSFNEGVTKDITLVASYKSELTYASLIDRWDGEENTAGTRIEYSVYIEAGGTGTAKITKGGEALSYDVVVGVNNGVVSLSFPGTSFPSLSLTLNDGRLVGTGIEGGELSLSRKATTTVTYHHFGGGESIERYAGGEGFRAIPCPLPTGLSLDGWYTEDGRLLAEGDDVSGVRDVYANTYTTGLLFDGDTVTGYEGEATEITIPTRFGGVSVTTVGRGAFENTDITSLNIPVGITEIGERAFFGCDALGSLRLPKGITHIGDYAFYDCISIPEINIPDSVERIGFAAFGSTLGSVELDSGDTAVFSANVTLTSLSLPFIGESRDGENRFIGYIFGASAPEDNWIEPDGKEYTLGEESGIATIFYYLPASLWSIEVRELSVIPEKAFYSCIYVEEFELQGMVTELEDSAFENCVNADISGLNMVEKIGDRALLNTDFDGSIFHVLEYIGDYAFAYTELTEIHFPETLTHIGDAAFLFTGLSEVTFPAAIEYIGDSAFWGCNSLTRATFLGTVVPEIGSDLFTVVEDDATFYTDVLITVPGTLEAGQPYEAYRADLFLRDYASGIFPESVKGDTGYIVHDKTLIGYIRGEGEELTVINVPAGVTAIADYAFYNCGKITDINLPEGFERIGKYAFYGCTSVAYLNMPSTMKEIDDYAFTGFFVGNNLTRLYFPEGFVRIGEGAFMSSFNLRIVELPSTLEYVGYLAFGMANSLERITFAGVTPPTVGTYENENDGISCEIFQIINTGKLSVFVPGGCAAVYKNADGFSNVSDYVKVQPDGPEVGIYGNGSYIVELDGSGGVIISNLVLADEDTSDMGGTRYVFHEVYGSYSINGTYIAIECEEYGRIEGVYAASVRRMMLTIGDEQLLFTEPNVYYDDYNWATFKLFEDGTGVFDMYGSFITPLKWAIDGDKFNLTIDGNNKLPENIDFAGERLYVGEYDSATGSFKVEFMLNDYSTALELDATELLYVTGEVTRLYGKYIAYAENGYALFTIDAYGNGECDFYIGESKYEGCTYTIEDGVITVNITMLEVTLTMDRNGRLYGASALAGSDVTFVFVDEKMDSTKMPD